VWRGHTYKKEKGRGREPRRGLKRGRKREREREREAGDSRGRPPASLFALGS